MTDTTRTWEQDGDTWRTYIPDGRLYIATRAHARGYEKWQLREHDGPFSGPVGLARWYRSFDAVKRAVDEREAQR